MDVFTHHIYEYEKGLRNLVLYTAKTDEIDYIESKLQKREISYVINKVNGDKANVYFGNPTCIEVVKTFGEIKLNELSNEQDYILGIMLGYDRLKQCDRYLKRRKSILDDLIG